MQNNGLMMEGWLYMNNALQWSISWNSALLPPQEMLPPESLLFTVSCDNTTLANSKHLFGFESYVPCLTTERNWNASSEEDTPSILHENSCDATYEDFLALLMIEKCTPSL